MKTRLAFFGNSIHRNAKSAGSAFSVMQGGSCPKSVWVWELVAPREEFTRSNVKEIEKDTGLGCSYTGNVVL